MHPMLKMTLTACACALGFSLVLPLFLDRLHPLPRKLIGLLLPFCISLFILAATLRRASSGIQKINLTPFWSYRQWKAQDVRWQIMMNIALFVPLGASLRSLRLHPLAVFLLGAGLSGFIEYTQYRYALGLCEIDDVINNTLGALLGFGLYCLGERLLAEWKARSARRE